MQDISKVVISSLSQPSCKRMRQRSHWQVQDGEGEAMSPELLAMLRTGLT